MDGETAALVTTAASTVVTLMATDAWGRAKAGVTALWRRQEPDRAEDVERQLDETRLALTAQAEGGVEGGTEDVRGQLTDEWRRRLGGLVTADPGAPDRLRQLLGDLSSLLPETADGARVHVDQHAKAKDRARIIQGGRDVHVHVHDAAGDE